MNDKKQLAAMGEHMAEQPLCMAKRIEELEAQVRVMAGLLREAQECVVHDVVRGMGRDVESLWARIDATLAGQVTEPAFPRLSHEERSALARFNQCCEDGQGYDVEKDMMIRLARIGVLHHRSAGYYEITDVGIAMLAAAPKPEAK